MIVHEIPRPHKERLQTLLDQGDTDWFARHRDARHRIRFYFLGEVVEGDAPVECYVVVTIEAGRLVRRFTGEGGAA